MTAIRTKLGIDPGVFYVSAAISILFVGWGVLFTENLASVAGAVLDYIIRTFGWVFVLATIGFLVFAVFLGVSRYGKIRLGQDDDRPEFRTGWR